MPKNLLPTQFLLYGDDYYDSHVVHFLLEEKGLLYDKVAQFDQDELATLNPYRTLPILVGKDVTLYETGVIFEYLEDRHQANKLLPITPKERAFVRTLAWRIQKDWLSLGKTLMTHSDSFDDVQAQIAKKTLTDTLLTIAPLFGKKPYFLSDTMGYCDILLVPFLWRLPKIGVHLPAHLCRPLAEYQARLYDRPSFKKTLSFYC